MLGRLARLPAPQREALQVIFGLSAGPAPDRFLVGLGVLTLVSEVAEERPLLCVVDDAHWLDKASALTLAFVARRLRADRVGIVFAAREPGDELQHVPDLELRGLRNGDARSLLNSAVRFNLDDEVRDRIVAEMGRQPAGAAGAAARTHGGAAGWRVRAAGVARALGPYRGKLCSTACAPARGHATATACRSRRAGRRSASGLARGGAARHRPDRRGSGWARRLVGDCRAGDLPSSAGAFGGVWGGGGAGSRGCALGVGGSDRPEGSSGSSGMASGGGGDGSR